MTTTKTRRPPIVTIMGHVDHGKTSILDYIRKTEVVKGEAGGITQSIGAYQITHNNFTITFIDTPGHYAFANMRARGGQLADIVVLVVAADDGVMPQTEEALSHAKAANVPIIVAINKIDMPGANVSKVKKQLADKGLAVEDYGGKVPAVETSAVTGVGIDDLLSAIEIVASDLKLEVDLSEKPVFTVVESFLDPKKGVIANGIVTAGTLKSREMLVGGTVAAKVKSMRDWQGNEIKEATCGTPVEIMGFDAVPDVGVSYAYVESGKDAEKILAVTKSDKITNQVGVSAKDRIKEALAAEGPKEIMLVIKAESQGSLEAVIGEVNRLSTDEVTLRVLHAGIGKISENDILLAVPNHGIVIGFHVDIERKAEDIARTEKIIYRLYEIIYELVDELTDVVKGEIEALQQQVLGEAKILKLFTLSDKSIIAGSIVKEGRVRKGNKVEIVRGNQIVAESRITSLRSNKEDVNEIKAGNECGIRIGTDIVLEIGDMIKAVSE